MVEVFKSPVNVAHEVAEKTSEYITVDAITIAPNTSVRVTIPFTKTYSAPPSFIFSYLCQDTNFELSAYISEITTGSAVVSIENQALTERILKLWGKVRSL
jgi:hypothetical protein